MGLNAFFAYYVCGVLGLHWTVALGAVFFSGIVFLLLTVTHVRQLLIDAVPMNLKYAIVVGIGMFIAFIGLQNAGIVVKNDATVVALGHVTQPGPLLACCGLMLTAGLMARNVQGSLLIGILVTAVLGMVFGVSPAPSGIDSVMSFSLPSLAPTLMQLDIMGALKYGIISIIFTFTIVELFDNMGTLIGLSRKARLMDDKGHIENLDKAIVIDQSPIGRTPRSNPATYTNLFNDIRDLFASTPDAKARGYAAGRFSFNVRGGRCEACSGDGQLKIEMHFLPDIYVPCEVCKGKRYNRETLEVHYKGKSIADVLEMTVEEGLEFFRDLPKLEAKLRTLSEVGLGYIRLGQSSTAAKPSASSSRPSFLSAPRGAPSISSTSRPRVSTRTM